MLNIGRSSTVQTLEPRLALTGDFASLAAQIAADVDLDGSLTLGDALEVVADLRQSGPRESFGPALARLDANQDGQISLADAMTVVARLRDNASEGEWLDQADWLTEERRENIRQFLSNLGDLRLESFVSPESIGRLVADLTAALEGASLPTQESLDTLLANLETALENNELTGEETDQLLDDLAAALESAGVTQADIDTIQADIEEIIATGVDVVDIDTIVRDIRSIVEAFPGLSADRLDAIDALIEDIYDVTEDSLPDGETIDNLVDAFEAIADGAEIPDYSLILQVLGDVRQSRNDGQIDDSERDTIANSIDAVFASANIPQVERDALRDAFDGGFGGLFQQLLDFGRRILDIFPIFRR